MSSSALWRTKKAKLSIVIAGILSTEAFATTGGFAALPLNVERSISDFSRGSELRINPNVLFLIDDTGSMGATVGRTGLSRIRVTREAMVKLAAKHQDALNYYVLDLCGTSQQMPQVGKPLNHKEFQTVIGRMQAKCGDTTDHSIEGYYDAIFFLRKNMNEADGQYRCQKNFLLYFGDGESNPTRVAWDKDGVAYAQDSSMRTGRFAGNEITTFRFIRSLTDGRSNWDCHQRTSESIRPDQKQYCRYARTHKDEWKKYAKFEPAPPGSTGDSKVFDESMTHWSVTNYIGYSVLAGPAEWIGKNDLVTATSAKSPVDAGGKSWDDPNIPIQTIGTYAIGLGVTPGSATGGRYLHGASASAEDHQAILAQDPQALFEGLDKILSDIKEKSKPDIPDTYSSTSPASLGGAKLDSGVTVHLLEGTTRSQMRFFKYDPVTKKFETTFTTPALPPRNDTRFGALPSGTPQRPVLAHANNQYFFLQNPPAFLNNGHFGITDSGKNRNEFKEAMIPWITFSADDIVQTNDEKVNTAAANQNYDYPLGISKGDRYRVRKTVSGKDPNEYYMGDILDSPIVAGGANDRDLPEFLFASSNDGLSYIFKRQTENPSGNITQKSPYSLILRYFPMEMDRDVTGNNIGKEMNILRRNDYAVEDSNYQHQWMNNGGITVRSMTSRHFKDSKYQHSMVVSTPGQGGRGIFALTLGGHDFFTGQPSGINNRTTSWTRSIPLFETPKGDKNDLGYILGNPSVARLSLCRINSLPGGHDLVFDSSGIVKCDSSASPVDVKQNTDYGVVYTAIYGNGYRHPENILSGAKEKIKSALHVRLLWNKDVGLKASGAELPGVAPNGLQIAKIEVDNYSGLSMPISVDMDFDGVVDLAYAATYDGELYRFDFRGNNPTEWKATKLFSTQTVPYKYLQSDSNGAVVDGTGTPILLDGTGDFATVKQKVMMAPDIFRFEGERDSTTGKKPIRYMVSFGTGSNVFLTDLYDRSLQSTYSIEDRPEEMEDFDKNLPITLDKLGQREFVDLASGLRDIKPRPTSLDPKATTTFGWYANFDSKDKFGYPFGERMVASPIMIKDMVINNTVVYEFSRSNAFTRGEGKKVDLCEKEDRSEIKNAGWIMGLNPKNGDSNSPEVDTSSEEHKNFKPKKVSLDGLSKGNPEDGSGGVGKRLESVTNYTLFHRRQSVDSQSSVTDNGGLLSGLDPELKGMSIPRNDCMTRQEAESIRLIGAHKKGLADDVNILPKICPSSGGVLRLNIRDIPL